MALVIIDYGSGNLRSAEKAFYRASQMVTPVPNILVSRDPEEILKAERLVLPGVGAFGDCMHRIKNIEGMLESLIYNVIKNAQPFLGICVGMQLMASEGNEYGIHKGLGWIKGKVVPIDKVDNTLKIPHMGWNEIVKIKKHKLLSNLTLGTNFYFVHSYKFVTESEDYTYAYTNYNELIGAVVGEKNYFGTQFHPEKSQSAGIEFIKNFLEWMP